MQLFKLELPPTHLETTCRCVESSPTNKTSPCCVELGGAISHFSFIASLATCRKRHFSWATKAYVG